MTLQQDKITLPFSLCWPLLLASCATYSDRTGGALLDFEDARFIQAEQVFEDIDYTHSPFLSGAEAGLIALTDGRYQAAIDHFQVAFDEVRDLEEAALVDPESLSRGLSTWALNEELAAYRGEGYERVMLHALWGLAYLGLGEVEDMMVEVRRSNRLLAAEERFHEKDYRAGGLATFLSAVGHELTGQIDEAYVDYKLLDQLGISESLYGPSLVRLSSAMGLADDQAKWEAKFGQAGPVPEGSARVILIAGLGMGPTKREERLTVQTKDGLLTVAVPKLVRGRQLGHSVVLRVSNHAVRTTPLEDLQRIAKESLSDRISWLVARSLVRTVVKREVRKKLEDEAGVAGAVLGDLFNLATERADLRCWSTLPDTWAAARIFVPGGEHQVFVEAPSGGVADLGRIRLDPGETMFVFVRTLGHDIHVRQVGGLSIPPLAEQSKI